MADPTDQRNDAVLNETSFCLEAAFKLGNITRDLMKDTLAASKLNLTLAQKLKFQAAAKLLDEASRTFYSVTE